MDLRDFRKALAVVIGQPTELRPFVCNGSPLACRAFLVGYNPATEMRAGFWDFWTDEGFEMNLWLNAYERARELKPLRPGKKSRPRISPSRRVIEWIMDGAGIPILETNLYARPTVDMKSLDEKDLAPFRFLLEVIQPAVIVAHGKAARNTLATLSPCAKVLGVPHFSRGWSRERANELGAHVRALVQARSPLT